VTTIRWPGVDSNTGQRRSGRPATIRKRCCTKSTESRRNGPESGRGEPSATPHPTEPRIPGRFSTTRCGRQLTPCSLREIRAARAGKTSRPGVVRRWRWPDSAIGSPEGGVLSRGRASRTPAFERKEPGGCPPGSRPCPDAAFDQNAASRRILPSMKSCESPPLYLACARSTRFSTGVQSIWPPTA
jgi:hypothetical protein